MSAKGGFTLKFEQRISDGTDMTMRLLLTIVVFMTMFIIGSYTIQESKPRGQNLKVPIEAWTRNLPITMESAKSFIWNAT